LMKGIAQRHKQAARITLKIGLNLSISSMTPS
jgi:hypothetical protein